VPARVRISKANFFRSAFGSTSAIKRAPRNRPCGESQRKSAPAFAGLDTVFAFAWPSVVYALDILAWDVFFALAAGCGIAMARALTRGHKPSSTLILLHGLAALSGNPLHRSGRSA